MPSQAGCHFRVAPQPGRLTARSEPPLLRGARGPACRGHARRSLPCWGQARRACGSRFSELMESTAVAGRGRVRIDLPSPGRPRPEMAPSALSRGRSRFACLLWGPSFLAPPPLLFLLSGPPFPPPFLLSSWYQGLESRALYMSASAQLPSYIPRSSVFFFKGEMEFQAKCYHYDNHQCYYW